MDIPKMELMRLSSHFTFHISVDSEPQRGGHGWWCGGGDERRDVALMNIHKMELTRLRIH